MSASGTVSVELTPQDDDGFSAGRMLIKKSYAGGLIAGGTGQMISKRTESGAAVYYAIEEVSGSLDGRKGSFTLVHKGYMDGESQALEITILRGSGTGELQSISGSMVITQDEDGHQYQLSWEL
jgi:hypothetical protein